MSELVRVEHVETHNWRGAMRGMRNPMESWNKSDSVFLHGNTFQLGQNDYGLAIRLIRAGSDHRKFLRQIQISADITCAWGIWKEYATYKVGTVENSTSQMHKLGSKMLEQSDFGIDIWDELNISMLEIINTRIHIWKNLKNRNGSPEDIKQAWRNMIQCIPASFLYLRTCTLNYEVLRNIYRARKNHKQVEWHMILDKLLAEIPYPEFITMEGN